MGRSIALFVYGVPQDNFLGFSIHHDDKAIFLVEVSAVKNEVFELAIVKVFLGHLLKPVVLNAFELGLTMT